MWQPDIAVVGSGPASLAAAGAVLDKGLSVAVVAPDLDAPWPNHYGVWAEELRALGLNDMLARVWDAPSVHVAGGWSKTLRYPYAQVDRMALKELLVGRCRNGNARFVHGRVCGACHDATGSTLALADGSTLRASVIIDASGHKPCLVERSGTPKAFQTAYGIQAEVVAHPYEPGQMAYMDFRAGHLPSPAARAEPPSFLYAMPASPQEIFLEETCLVGRPPIPLAELKARLYRRLAHTGIQVLAVHAEEHCTIPMDAPLPRLPQRVVGFGGAAGMVNPATGYMLAQALVLAPELANALSDGLSLPSGGPERASERAWSAVWPNEQRKRHQVYAFGREALLGLSSPEISAFVRAFFSLPDEKWRGYLSNTLGAPALLFVMASIVGTAPPSLSWALARSSMTRGGMSLLRSAAASIST
jgi:lycopene cyclase-like protein